VQFSLYNYETIKGQWNVIINKLKVTDAEIDDIELDEPASETEIQSIERKLNILLPPSYKYFLLNVSKRLWLAWFLDEEDMESVPEELGEIFSGILNVNIEELEDLTAYADEWFEDGVDHGVNWRNKLKFASSSNGDIYAFDLSFEGVEKPVYYIEHDGDGVHFIANSFHEYVSNITELCLVGNEWWQLEAFIDGEIGLNPNGEAAQVWKRWFEDYVYQEKL
jgi:hypothetical protein